MVGHKLSKRHRCELLGIARSTAYYQPKPAGQEVLSLMRRLDELHLKYPHKGLG